MQAIMIPPSILPVIIRYRGTQYSPGLRTGPTVDRLPCEMLVDVVVSTKVGRGKARCGVALQPGVVPHSTEEVLDRPRTKPWWVIISK